jgi:phosphoribosyl 1,2-cyclic phosphodiesterase
VRGSIPTPRAEYLGVGGNTSCLEVGGGGSRIIIDAGSGIRELGELLLDQASGSTIPIDLLLTHFHWDHIQGLPFFAPLFSSESQVSFYTCKPAGQIREFLEGQMSRPYFPVPFEAVAAKREFYDLDGETLAAGPIRIRAFPVNHPQGACGFRIENGSTVIVHVTDHEHGDAAIDAGVRDCAAGADVLIFDAQFTPEEYSGKRGWGHSTYVEAARVARDAGAKQLILFHHDPHHDDKFMHSVLEEARRCFENTELAREGWTVEP